MEPLKERFPVHGHQSIIRQAVPINRKRKQLFLQKQPDRNWSGKQRSGSVGPSFFNLEKVVFRFLHKGQEALTEA